jgi:sugar/nucleoside kinase (ribokinase family)
MFAENSYPSPNAGEALRLLSIPHDLKSLNRPLIEESAHRLLSLGVGSARPKPEDAAVIIRSAELGAYVVKKAVDGGYDGRWVEAYWTKGDESKVVDVTGAGNSFLGGVAAGLHLSKRNVYEGVSPYMSNERACLMAFSATLYGSVSASFVIEQQGLPKLTTVNGVDMWNGELPRERLQKLRDRHQ